MCVEGSTQKERDLGRRVRSDELTHQVSRQPGRFVVDASREDREETLDGLLLSALDEIAAGFGNL